MNITRILPLCLLFSAPLAVAQDAPEPPDGAALTARAAQNGATPAQLRMLSELLRTPALNGVATNTGMVPYVRDVQFIPNVDAYLLLAHVNPGEQAHWYLVADSEGRVLCRIDNHLDDGGWKVEQVWRKGGDLRIEYTERPGGPVIAREFPLFNRPGDSQAHIHLGARLAVQEDFLCDDEEESLETDNIIHTELSPSGAFRLLSESVYNRDTNHKGGYILFLENVADGSSTPLLKGHGRCAHTWLRYGGRDVLVLKRQDYSRSSSVYIVTMESAEGQPVFECKKYALYAHVDQVDCSAEDLDKGVLVLRYTYLDGNVAEQRVSLESDGMADTEDDAGMMADARKRGWTEAQQRLLKGYILPHAPVHSLDEVSFLQSGDPALLLAQINGKDGWRVYVAAGADGASACGIHCTPGVDEVTGLKRVGDSLHVEYTRKGAPCAMVLPVFRNTDVYTVRLRDTERDIEQEPVLYREAEIKWDDSPRVVRHSVSPSGCYVLEEEWRYDAPSGKPQDYVLYLYAPEEEGMAEPIASGLHGCRAHWHSFVDKDVLVLERQVDADHTGLYVLEIGADGRKKVLFDSTKVELTTEPLAQLFWSCTSEAAGKGLLMLHARWRTTSGKTDGTDFGLHLDARGDGADKGE